MMFYVPTSVCVCVYVSKGIAMLATRAVDPEQMCSEQATTTIFIAADVKTVFWEHSTSTPILLP